MGDPNDASPAGSFVEDREAIKRAIAGVERGLSEWNVGLRKGLDELQGYVHAIRLATTDRDILETSFRISTSGHELFGGYRDTRNTTPEAIKQRIREDCGNILTRLQSRA